MYICILNFVVIGSPVFNVYAKLLTILWCFSISKLDVVGTIVNPCDEFLLIISSEIVNAVDMHGGAGTFFGGTASSSKHVAVTHAFLLSRND
jgi:hypothetical protein